MFMNQFKTAALAAAGFLAVGVGALAYQGADAPRPGSSAVTEGKADSVTIHKQDPGPSVRLTITASAKNPGRITVRGPNGVELSASELTLDPFLLTQPGRITVRKPDGAEVPASELTRDPFLLGNIAVRSGDGAKTDGVKVTPRAQDDADDRRAEERAEAEGHLEILQMEVQAEQLQIQNVINDLKQIEFKDNTNVIAPPEQLKRMDEMAQTALKRKRRLLEELEVKFIADKAKLAREQRRLARLVSEPARAPGAPKAGRQPAPGADPPAPDGEKLDRQIQRVREVETMRTEVELLEMRVQQEQQSLSRTQQMLVVSEQPPVFGMGMGMGNPPTKEEAEKARRFEEERAKELREHYEHLRTIYLEHKLELAEKKLRLSALEQRLGDDLPGPRRVPADLDRRLTEVESKLDQLIKRADEKK